MKITYQLDISKITEEGCVYTNYMTNPPTVSKQNCMSSIRCIRISQKNFIEIMKIIEAKC